MAAVRIDGISLAYFSYVINSHSHLSGLAFAVDLFTNRRQMAGAAKGSVL